jgi:hypothetical protein
MRKNKAKYSNIMANIHRFIQSAFIFLSIAGLSQATVRAFMFWNAPQMGLLFAVKDGGLYRHSENIVLGVGAYVWSNRILSPYMLFGMTKFGMTYQMAAIIFYWVGIFLNNYVFYYLMRKSSVPVAASFAWLVAFNLFFIIFQDKTSHGCFYTWDMLCILFFSIFAYFVVTEKPVAWFIPLFLIAITNREDAAFIALYLILSSVVITGFHYRKWVVLKLRLLTGVALMAAGFLFTTWARNHFTTDRPPVGNVTYGNTVISVKTALHNLFIKNFDGERDSFFFKIPDGFWLIASSFCVMYFFRSVNRPRQHLTMIYLMLVASIVVFGNHLENETRLYMPLFPIFAFIMAGPLLQKTLKGHSA